MAKLLHELKAMLKASFMTEKRLRVLCLHGYRQNNAIFREKTGSLRKLLKKNVDFEFMSAPLTPSVSAEINREDIRGWWFSKPSNEFSSKDVTEIATGFEESVEAVVKFVQENGPFDGVLGFSQGACMAHLLLALQEAKKIELGFQFAIFFAGFLSLSSVHNELNKPELRISSFHVYGESDDIVNMQRSKELEAKFIGAVSVTHDGGHCVPSMTKSKEPIRKFIENQLI